MFDQQKQESFQGFSIVSCGTLRPELTFLQGEGFLNTDNILYTTPGLHEIPRDLENQLIRQIKKGREYAERIIVVYGNRCYLDFKDPLHTVDSIAAAAGDRVFRVEAANCVDMLADSAERENIAGGDKVYWLTMGWLLFWKVIFKDWDPGKANETFPQHDKAVLLDPANSFEKFCEAHPEKVLEFSDWMKIPIEPHPVSLKRLKSILIQAKNKIIQGG
jgi:hypothetical protein